MQQDLSNSFNCPYCGTELDSVTGFEDTKIANDDFTICVQCANICNYVISDNKYSLRKTTEADIQNAKETGVYGQIEQLIDFIKSKDSRIIRPNN